MKKGAKRNQIISELLHVTDEEFTDEELIHQLIATEVTKNADKDEHMTFGQRAADAVARFAGSWAFIFSFIAVMVIWMVINLVLGSRAFDEYPFILLNLVLSCIAAVQAPLIMMICTKSLTLFWKTKRRSTAAWTRLKRRLRRKTRENNALHIKIWEIVLKKHHHP